MRIIKEVVFSALFFGYVLYVCLIFLINVVPAYRCFHKNGKAVRAKVTGFEATKLGEQHSDKFFVDITAVPPGESAPKNYKLSTCHGNGRRYDKVTECEVIFAEGEPEPVLEEEILLWRRDIVVSFVGVFLSLGMLILFILAAWMR